MSTRLVTDCLFRANQLNGKTVEFFLVENDTYQFSQGADIPHIKGVGELVAYEEGIGFYLDIMVQFSDFEEKDQGCHVCHNEHIMLTKLAAARIIKNPESNVADFLIPEQIWSEHSDQTSP